MRDGVRLATDIYFPHKNGNSHYPAILVRTPYGKLKCYECSVYAPVIRKFIENDFIVILQDCRGRFQSEGEFEILRHEANDGWDTLDWIACQPWSNGKVGTYGGSFSGENQILLAAKRHPAHVTAIAEAAGGAIGAAGGLYEYLGLFENGVITLGAMFSWLMLHGSSHMPRLPVNVLDPNSYKNLERRFLWDIPAPEIDLHGALHHLPLVEAMKEHVGPGFHKNYEIVIDNPVATPFWDEQGFIRPDSKFSIPILHVNSWFDYGAAAVFEIFNLAHKNATNEVAQDNQYLIMFPTAHCGWHYSMSGEVGGRSMGDFSIGYPHIYLQWFTQWLKGIDQGLSRWPKLRLYIAGRNQWYETNEFPGSACSYETLFLEGGQVGQDIKRGVLVRTASGASGQHAFIYDPANPVPSSNGGESLTDLLSPGFVNHAMIESREDVLLYTTEAFSKEYTILGSVEAVLYISSSAPDTDFTVKLVEVASDNVALHLVDGIVRARYRDGVGSEVPMRAGQVYRLSLRLHPIAVTLKAGHRLRIEISSSNFPKYARNLNTGLNNYTTTEIRVAHNKLHWGGQHPSFICLPFLTQNT